MNEEQNNRDDWNQFLKEARRQWRMQAVANVGLLALTAGVLILVLMRT